MNTIAQMTKDVIEERNKSNESEVKYKIKSLISNIGYNQEKIANLVVKITEDRKLLSEIEEPKILTLKEITG